MEVTQRVPPRTDEEARALHAMAVGVAALMALAVLSGVELAGLLHGVDSAVLDVLEAHRTGTLDGLARSVTATGTSPLLFPLVGLAGFAVAARRRRWWPAICALVAVVTGVLVRLGMSKAYADPRPPQSAWLVPVHGFSFPSGHAATSALVAGALVWLTSCLVRSAAVRCALGAVLGGWALLVAVSRLYLGVHWVSDVVASWLLAGVVLAVLTAVGRWIGQLRPLATDTARGPA